MCGIVGYLGNENACSLVLEGLKRLEYRGYDSWGIVSCKEKSFSVEKRVGRISKASVSLPSSKVAIGHTRWATHGKVTDLNAHPHLDCSGKIAIVHNGIIENYAELKQQLIAKGHSFKSETDSEVIAHLIEEERKVEKDFVKAIELAVQKLNGSFAIAVIDGETGLVAGIRRNSPLVLGIKGEHEFFLASDVNAFLKHTKKVVFLEDNELVLLGKEKPLFRNFFLGKEIERKLVELDWDTEESEKQGFKHFMLKEISEQPEKLIATMASRLENGKVLLPELESVLKKAKDFNRIVFVGCGTAFYAALVQKYFFEQLCNIPVEAEYASEFRYKDPVVDEKTLVVSISQSGETADTLAAVREAKKKKAKVLSIINVVGSTIARESDYVLYIKAGPEIGVASTKAFTCQLTGISLLAIAFASRLGSAKEKYLEELVEDLKRLPALLKEVLEEKEKIRKIAEKYVESTNALFLGRGINYPVALEGALKLKEISYIHAEAMPAAEMKHGPIALIDSQMPVVFLAIEDKSYDKILGNIEEVKARGGKVIAVSNKGNLDLQKNVDEIIFVPKTHELLQPIINVVPLQLFAYYAADKKGCDIDKPRNLAKSVTVE